MVNRGSGSSVPVKVARDRKYEEVEKRGPTLSRIHPGRKSTK